MRISIAHAMLVWLAVSAGCTETTTAGGGDGGSAEVDGGSGGGSGGTDGGSAGTRGGSGGTGSTGGATGGSGGTSASDSDASTSTGDPVEVADAGPGVPCGAEVCDEGACCADPFVSLCGAPIGERGCLLPSPESTSADPRCPSVDVMGFFTIPSCCTADGQCGIDATNFGSGCVSLAMAAEMAMQMGGGASFVTWPPPQPCE